MTQKQRLVVIGNGMAGARLPGIRIQEPGCVAKTYPGFWEDLQRVGVHVQQV